MSLLAQLNHVLCQLDRPWRKALMDRSRLSDLVFIGDFLAVLSMCSTGLRAGTPLPQITPSPLVERFVSPTCGEESAYASRDWAGRKVLICPKIRRIRRPSCLASLPLMVRSRCLSIWSGGDVYCSARIRAVHAVRVRHHHDILHHVTAR